ncbi:hypothetical protein CDQ84_03100 [Clostridium thermosuccinogenes]|uniref:CBM6 domain-containing protein n=1 Tax=Clostridium thermosuccinogenes TaxID=84032 RepID=A0A2K2FQR4_9CLOT|nr:carbohydrate-binding protein [Pseudoclostridium thermosuccinogenes]AUS96050.1 hypothetical protein CDO33_06125 [Pseudoclostridium thermosuccinogenes]PNT99438.1 hypothetical protein CDQ85_03100 [Pseudoclostridium thermosuccinogenes]PNU01125.1 hypothetical protein CDQ84_03100 [Pseudoclostridium thermosuccinogenes]
MSKSIKTWAVLLTAALVFQVFSFLVPQQAKAEGNIYYVATTGNDNNSGSKDEPFLTIQKAMDVASPGDTVYIRGGTYYITSPITITKSGEAGKPITLAAYPGETPVIDGQNKYPDFNFATYTYNGQTYEHSWEPLIKILASHIVVDGLEITRSYGKGIEAGNVTGEIRYSDITVKNCKIHHNWATALEFEHLDNSLADNNEIWQNNIFAPFDRRPEDVRWPVILLIATCSHTTVQNNKIYNNWGEAIGIWSNFRTPSQISKYITVQDNEVFDNYAVEIYIDHGAYVTVQRNLVYKTGDTTFYRDGAPCAGILISDELYGDGTPPVGHHRKIINNFAKGNLSNIAYWYQGVEGSALNNDLIAHNTLVDAYNDGIYIAAADHINTRIENNIIKQSSGNLVRTEQDPELHFSHNCWSGSVSGIASSANDVIGDPKLTGGALGENYFKLKSDSPCIGAGKEITSDVPYDYFNNLRSDPDIGAHEYNGSSPTPTPVMLFSDDFEDGYANGWTTNYGTFSVVNDGSNKAYYSSESVGGANSYAGESTWDDYTVEAKIKVDSWEGTNSRAGIVARRQNSSNYYHMFYSKSDSKISIYKLQGANHTLLASSNVIPAPSTGVYHTYKFEVSGNILKAYLDGQLMATATDDTFTTGNIACYTHFQKAFFDDIKVEGQGVSPEPDYLFKEAESYDSKLGDLIALNSTTVGASGDAYVGWTQNNDYLVFSNIDLSKIDSVETRTATIYDDSTIEFRAGSPTGTLLGIINVPNTGSWAAVDKWATASAEFSDASGIQDIYVVFKRSGSGVADIDWIKFYLNSDTPVSGNLLANPGFESGSEDWDLWENASIVTNNAYSGSRCVRIGTGIGGFSHSTITSGVYENTNYYIEAWGKADSGNNIYVYVDCRNSSGTTIQSFTMPIFNSTSYVKNSLQFTTPAGTTQIAVWTWKNGTSGYVYMDDFLLRQD